MERYQDTVVMTVQEQRELLSRPVHRRFIKRDPNVRGQFTTGDYVKTMLNTIFGPDNWSHEILRGPEIVKLNDNYAYAQAVVRLTVQFANGQQVIHDDMGIWPLSSGSRSLDDAKPERFETVLKASITDGLKACTTYLGACFRPMADEQLEAYLRKRQASQRQAEEPEAEDDVPDEEPEPQAPESQAPQIEPEARALQPADGDYDATQLWSEFYSLKDAGKITAALREDPEFKRLTSAKDWMGARKLMHARMRV